MKALYLCIRAIDQWFGADIDAMDARSEVFDFRERLPHKDLASLIFGKVWANRRKPSENSPYLAAAPSKTPRLLLLC